MAKIKQKKRSLPPSTFADTTRGKRERFNNRKKTLSRKTLEINRKCRVHAITIVDHNRDGLLTVTDTRKGSGTEWPHDLHSFLSKIDPGWISGPEDFAKPVNDEEDESDLSDSYRSQSCESLDSKSSITRTSKESNSARKVTNRPRPRLLPLSPTLGGPKASLEENLAKAFKHEPVEESRISNLPFYGSPPLSNSSRRIRPRLERRTGSRTPPKIRLPPLSPTLRQPKWGKTNESTYMNYEDWTSVFVS